MSAVTVERAASLRYGAFRLTPLMGYECELPLTTPILTIHAVWYTVPPSQQPRRRVSDDVRPKSSRARPVPGGGYHRTTSLTATLRNCEVTVLDDLSMGRREHVPGGEDFVEIALDIRSRRGVRQDGSTP